MSRQQSPSIPPEAAYIEESSTPSIPAQSSYYEASTQRQLMTDEMMDDISRIAGAGQSSDLLNGQNHHALSSILQATTSNAPDPTSPMTPTQQEQPPLSAHDSLSQQRQSYRLDSASSDQYADGGNKRKRSKVSRACDECRRKKVRTPQTREHPMELWLTLNQCRFVAMLPKMMGLLRLARIVSASTRRVLSVGNP